MWYVMQVRTGTEENIRCQCQRLISSDILKRCFIPYYQQKKRFQGKWHIQERILFPGYVFLIAENLEQLAENLRKVTGMTRLLGTGDEIIPLSQEEVELLLKLGKEEQMERKLAVSMFGQKRLSREGGIEIVAKELCTRMVQIVFLCAWEKLKCWSRTVNITIRQWNP